MPEFKLANLLTDTKILEKTQLAVKELVAEDKKLILLQNQMIKKELLFKYGEQLNSIVG